MAIFGTFRESFDIVRGPSLRMLYRREWRSSVAAWQLCVRPLPLPFSCELLALIAHLQCLGCWGIATQGDAALGLGYIIAAELRLAVARGRRQRSAAQGADTVPRRWPSAFLSRRFAASGYRILALPAKDALLTPGNSDGGQCPPYMRLRHSARGICLRDLCAFVVNHLPHANSYQHLTPNPSRPVGPLDFRDAGMF